MTTPIHPAAVQVQALKRVIRQLLSHECIRNARDVGPVGERAQSDQLIKHLQEAKAAIGRKR